jgi:glutathione S-transferase
MALKLYGNAWCPYSQRVRIVAVEKNIPVHYIHVPLGADVPTWFKQINPRGTTPVLSVAGGIIADSMRIAQYLDSAFPPPHALFPQRSGIRADIREFVNLVDHFAVKGMQALKADDFESHRLGFEDTMQELETRLVAHSQGPFFLGTNFSLADVAIIPFLDRFRHGFPVFCGLEPFAEWPRLRNLLHEAEHRMSVLETRLTRQESLEALEQVIGRKHREHRPLVRVETNSVTDARLWVAAAMSAVSADLERVPAGSPKDARVCYNARRIHHPTNAMMFLLESFGSPLLPESAFDEARAGSIIDAADAAIVALDEHRQGLVADGKLKGAIQALEALVIGPFAVGDDLTFADAVLAPLTSKYCALYRRRIVQEPLPRKLQAIHDYAMQDSTIRTALEAISPNLMWS